MKKHKLRLSTLELSSVILAMVLLFCFLPLPYGFYTIIRLVTAVIAACWAYQFYAQRKTALTITAICVVLLFQPFIKITLDKLTWNIVDILIACGIIVLVVSRHKLINLKK